MIYWKFNKPHLDYEKLILKVLKDPMKLYGKNIYSGECYYFLNIYYDCCNLVENYLVKLETLDK